MQRAADIINFIDELIHNNSKYEDKVFVGLENLQGSFNYTTSKVLSQMLGIIEFFLYCQDIKYEIIPAATWRKEAGIKGKTREEKKKNAIQYIEDKYGIITNDDAAEALCIAEYLYKQQGFG